MANTSSSVTFLYSTAVGRFLLKTVMALHLDRIAVWFLRSCLSKPMIKGYVKRNGIAVTDEQLRSFKTYREMFVRTRDTGEIDGDPTHFISPCDGWLSAFTLDDGSKFFIKSSIYTIKDFLQDDELAKSYKNGLCLIFRLCASDYHHYCYVDSGKQGKNHFIEGKLHSVQPICCETYPVYLLNRRSWCLMETDNFGPVVQCEIGALVVGGIENEKENASFAKGEEKGHFELAGSTIILLVQKDRIELCKNISDALKENAEVRVHLGDCVASAKEAVKDE